MSGTAMAGYQGVSASQPCGGIVGPECAACYLTRTTQSGDPESDR